MSEKTAVANYQTLLKLFTKLEPGSTLSDVDQALSDNLSEFLSEHIVAEPKAVTDIESQFSNPKIPEQPEFVSKHTQHLLQALIKDSVHTSSPFFIGHMTSALPSFHLPLAKLLVGLNQNLVKVETSKAFTPMERQVVGMLHHCVYQCDDDFYDEHLHKQTGALGNFCSGGTIANLTALWVARNLCLNQINPGGVSRKGLMNILRNSEFESVAVLVSKRGHYSLSKAMDILGLGRENLITIPTDRNQKISVPDLEQTIAELKLNKAKLMAIVGIAGTTETGNIDPLPALAKICQREQCHFHVDAAWGGATLLSSQHRSLLAGIEHADSVTIDAHKQMYVPMGSGMVLFKDPQALNTVKHHAEYIIRKGSKDLGSTSVEGSRPGSAMLLYSAFHILGRQGYELLIDRSIELAKTFADLIKQSDEFELISEPELCLLTYRYIPKSLRESAKLGQLTPQDNEKLDQLVISMQKAQRESGRSFVSRTRLSSRKYEEPLVVFRVVIANPLTTQDVLKQILEEQMRLGEHQAHQIFD